MKIFLSLILSIGITYAEEKKKDVDFNELFSQLDKVISAKKDKKVIKKEETQYRSENTSKREKNYKDFNEAAKKYHIFRANKILKTVNKLVLEYNKKTSQKLSVVRFTSIAHKKFAYVSSKNLNTVVSKLKLDGKNLNDLKNYKRLLVNIGDYDIKTIAKVLIIVEQQIMNLRGLGTKKVKRKASKIKNDVPIQLIKNKILDENIKVININKENATLKFISS